MPAKKHIKGRLINLIPQEGLTSTISGRILLWVLSTFRVILIITEIFVIGSFISRFWLDAKNTDLSQEIKEKKAVISSLSEFESDFKDIQNRLLVYETYKKDNGVVLSNIKNLVSYKPQGMYFNTMTAEMNSVRISAVSTNEVQIQQYWVNLKESRKYEDLQVSDIKVQKGGVEFEFSLLATIKK